tara:strand:- start:190 stop:609 length:420 start_codon:yes stop_codon:yes gene_type:complete
MHTPKVIYENLPYIYFLLSIIILSTADNAILFGSAALFYFAGSITWTSRSHARRLDTPNKYAKSFFNRRLNDSLYELMPFIQLAIGTVLVMSFDNQIIVFISVALCIYSIQNIVLRIINRKRDDVELSYGKRMAAKKNK